MKYINFPIKQDSIRISILAYISLLHGFVNTQGLQTPKFVSFFIFTLTLSLILFLDFKFQLHVIFWPTHHLIAFIILYIILFYYYYFYFFYYYYIYFIFIFSFLSPLSSLFLLPNHPTHLFSLLPFPSPSAAISSLFSYF